MTDQPADAAREARISAVIQQVAELPDRTSPDDWPDAMLVTADELRQILIEQADADRTARPQGWQAAWEDGYKAGQEDARLPPGRARLLALIEKFKGYRDAAMPASKRLSALSGKVEIATIRKTLNVVVIELEAALLAEPPAPLMTKNDDDDFAPRSNRQQIRQRRKMNGPRTSEATRGALGEIDGRGAARCDVDGWTDSTARAGKGLARSR
jgi:hypothetical protein